jgi:hypothetical protein
VSRDPERAVSEAMRAQGGAGRPGPIGATGPRRPAPPPPAPFPTGWVLLIALLTGAVLGIALALLSIFSPGLLPAIVTG